MHPAQAGPELDRRYALETVGVLRAWDNVDGLFADYVSQAFKSYLNGQSRFNYVDLGRADTVISSTKISYAKVIDDPEILAQVARALRADTVVRTKIYKEGPRYRFNLEWLLSPKMEVLSTEGFSLEQPAAGTSLSAEELQNALQAALDRMVKKIPFQAHVTGRDRDSVTLNIGREQTIRKGDTVVIATIDEVKKHPLLKAVVDWRLSTTGRAVVEDIDDGIAFAKITEEQPGRQISKYQKIVQVLLAPELPEAKTVVSEDVNETEKKRIQTEPPRLGWGSAGLWLGSLSRERSSPGTTGKTGSSMFLGAKADGQLWLNRDWFVELGLGYGFATGYSQKNLTGAAAPNAVSLSPSVFQTRLDAGYTYLTTGEVSGPKGWVKFGYQGTSYSFSYSVADQTAPSSFSGLFLGLGGDLPVRNKFGAMIDFDFGILTSGEEQGSIASVSSARSIDFFLGGYYKMEPRMHFKVGLGVTSQGADFIGGGSLSQRVVSIGPSLVYFF